MYADATARFGGANGGQEIGLPPDWGGYLVEPRVVEFWQGRRGRMHDRLRYRRAGGAGDGWLTERLAP
jgi:pyridoxamine 5'-phosphate oxidase